MIRKQILEKISPFNLLQEHELNDIIPTLDERQYKKGDIIFKQGEQSQEHLFLITEGMAEIIVRNEMGTESVVGLRKQHEFFGETVVLTGKHYPATVQAVTDTRCILLGREAFEYLLEKNAGFAGYFSRILTDRLRDVFHEVVLEQSYEAYGMETQPFRKRVCDIMSAPVVTCLVSDSIKKVAQTLDENRISALVAVNEDNSPQGLITESDLVSKVLTREDWDRKLTAKDIMNCNLVSLPIDAFFYQALLAMIKNKIKHVIVMDNTELAGIVTVRDLVQSRSTGTLTIVDSIESQAKIEDLQSPSIETEKVLKAMVAEKAGIKEIFEVMTELNDRLTRKVISIAEGEMDSDGWGPPPTPYCWINMGSSGRKEQTLKTDQDNGIIYMDPPKEKIEKTKKYFAVLANKIVEGMAQIGFVKCKGNVMATNPIWCQPLSKWKSVTYSWIHEPQPEQIRNFTIFLDFRPIYGEKDLADNLRNYIIKTIDSAPVFLHFLTKDDLNNKVPLGLFRQFITKKFGRNKGEIDLKAGAAIHIVDCVRIFSLWDELAETNTFLRLQKLTEMGVIPKDDSEFVEAAYETIMNFRIRENIRKASLGKVPDNYINPHKLSRREQYVLREALLAISRLQSFTGSFFRVEGY